MKPPQITPRTFCNKKLSVKLEFYSRGPPDQVRGVPRNKSVNLKLDGFQPSWYQYCTASKYKVILMGSEFGPQWKSVESFHHGRADRESRAQIIRSFFILLECLSKGPAMLSASLLGEIAAMEDNVFS